MKSKKVTQKVVMQQAELAPETVEEGVSYTKRLSCNKLSWKSKETVEEGDVKESSYTD